MKSGKVFVKGTYCGRIVQDESSFRFTYDPEWLSSPNAEPVSLTLPLRAEPYESDILFPFFDGLIPEGYLLQIAMNRFGIRANDRMTLLLKTCRDSIGCVSVEEEQYE